MFSLLFAIHVQIMGKTSLRVRPTRRMLQTVDRERLQTVERGEAHKVKKRKSPVTKSESGRKRNRGASKSSGRSFKRSYFVLAHCDMSRPLSKNVICNPMLDDDVKWCPKKF